MAHQYGGVRRPGARLPSVRLHSVGLLDYRAAAALKARISAAAFTRLFDTRFHRHGSRPSRWATGPRRAHTASPIVGTQALAALSWTAAGRLALVRRGSGRLG